MQYVRSLWPCKILEPEASVVVPLYIDELHGVLNRILGGCMQRQGVSQSTLRMCAEEVPLAK